MAASLCAGAQPGAAVGVATRAARGTTLRSPLGSTYKVLAFSFRGLGCFFRARVFPRARTSSSFADSSPSSNTKFSSSTRGASDGTGGAIGVSSASGIASLALSPAPRSPLTTSRMCAQAGTINVRSVSSVSGHKMPPRPSAFSSCFICSRPPVESFQTDDEEFFFTRLLSQPAFCKLFCSCMLKVSRNKSAKRSHWLRSFCMHSVVQTAKVCSWKHRNTTALGPSAALEQIVQMRESIARLATQPARGVPFDGRVQAGGGGRRRAAGPGAN
mmetsp:Transcript_101356/g.285899  ORF Transcript_101356/g.285899 Transcript_101356/m.285899 type:complete len:272 (+) Transcript_101356:1260-2075(+)